MGSVATSNPVNRSHPLNTGLLVWYKVLPHLAGGGLWTDLLGQRHGVIGPGVGFLPDRVQFSGSGYVTIPGPIGISGGMPRTYAATLWPIATNPTQVIIAGGAGGSGSLSDMRLSSNRIYFACYGPLVYTYANIPTLAPTRVMITYSSGAISTTNTLIYFNGVPQPTTVSGSAAISTPDENWRIGSETSGGSYYSGGLDDVMIYNRCLSPNEATADYAEWAAGRPSTLNRYRDV